MRVRILLLAFALTIGCYESNAQISDQSRTFNLQEVLETALRNNFDLRVNNATIEYSESDLKNAFGKYLPNLSFNSSYQRQLNPIENVTVKNYDSYNMRLGANFTLFDGFGREANYSRAQKNLQASKLSLDQMLQNVYLDAYNEYINVVRSTQIIRARRENLDLGKAELERIVAKHEAGVLPINAVYAQEADLGTKEIDLITAENDLNASKARLLSIMGLSPDINAEFDASSIPSEVEQLRMQDFKQEVGSFPNAIAKALETRIDYQAAKLRYESSEFSMDIAKSAYYPTLSASTDWQWYNNAFSGFDKGNFYFGLNLSVPIFSNFGVDLQVQSMKLSLEQRNVELLKLEQSIKSSVQISYLTLQSAEKQVDISKKTVFSAQQNYNSTQERVQVGAATINDLILAGTQLITAQINQISAVYNYVRAQNDIRFAMGTLFK